MLTELRTAIKERLEAGGIRAFEYVGESMSPPCAAVVPADPYVESPAAAGTRGRPLPFRKVRVGIDVLLLVSREGGKASAAAMDALIEKAFVAFKDDDTYTIQTVARPRVVTTDSGSKYLGSVLTIEEVTEEP